MVDGCCKIPTALKYAYNSYAATTTNVETELEKLAGFLYREAELAVAGGIFYFGTEVEQKRGSGKKSSTQKSHHVCMAAGVSRRNDNRSISNNACVACQRDNHKTAECSRFARETVERRWFFIKKSGLCFKCLERGHSQTECKTQNCSHCERPHHALLHNPARAGKNRESSNALRGKHVASVSSAVTKGVGASQPIMTRRDVVKDNSGAGSGAERGRKNICVAG